MSFNIRLETPGDYRAVEELTREAFWNLHVPGCDEHYIAHVLRDCPAFLPELDFVLEIDGKVVGNIMYTWAKITPDTGEPHQILMFGPLSVMPGYQRMGVGSALVHHSLNAARAQGHRAVAIYGSPAYYHCFGFGPGKAYGIARPNGTFLNALMALELVPGALKDMAGRLYEDEAFTADPAKFEAYEKTFPYKEKCVTETQKVFQRESTGEE